MSTSELRAGQAVLILGYPELHDNSGLVATPGHVINTDATDLRTDFLMLGFSYWGGSGGPIVNTNGQVVGMVIGRYTVEWDSEADEWIYLNYLVAGTNVAKHLR